MQELFKLTDFRKPRLAPIKLLVIHHIGSKDGKLFGVGGTITWFTSVAAHTDPKTGKLNNDLASAHFIVPREQYELDKKKYDIIKFANDEDYTYHAGVSSWVIDGKKVTAINSYSIGYELQGDGNLIEYTDFQYEILIESLKEKCSKYKLSSDSIVGHEDIAPTRKVDPGKLFDWKRVRTGVEPKIMVTTFEPEVGMSITDRVDLKDVKEQYTADHEVTMPSGQDKPNVFVSMFRVVASLFKKRMSP